MSAWKYAAKWAMLGVAIALLAFTYNYFMVPKSLWGYEIFAGPGMLALSFFTEEIAFWPKMLIFLCGQYLCYFGVFFVIKKYAVGNSSR